jgi:hypothetical protein
MLSVSAAAWPVDLPALARLAVYPVHVRQDVIIMDFLDKASGTFWPIGYHTVRYAVL